MRTKLLGQVDNCKDALQPYIFTSSTTKEITENINKISAYSKSSNKEFNQSLKGKLIVPIDGILTPVGIDTKFDGKSNFSESDYSNISSFYNFNFSEQKSYYFIPEYAVDAWKDCKNKLLNGNIWTDISVVKDKSGYNISYSIYFPDKDPAGLARKSEYNISKVLVNNKEVPPAKGKKLGVIKTGNVYTGTLQVKDDLIKIQIDIEGYDKSIKLFYIDKNKNSEPEKTVIPEYYVSQLSGSSITSSSDIYQIGKENVFPLKKASKYKALVSFTVTNGGECPLDPGEYFQIEPYVKELSTSASIRLDTRRINYAGQLIYSTLIDIPSGTSFVTFNLLANITCSNGGTTNNGHINSCNIFVFAEN